MNQEYWECRFEKEGALYCTKKGNDDEQSRQQADRLFEVIRPHLKGQNVLDYGCGPGRMSGPVRAICQGYHGVDILDLHKFFPPGMFNQLEADGTIPLPNSWVGTVVICTVLQHIIDQPTYEKLITEVVRVIVPGGRVIIVDDAGPCTAPHMFYRSPAQLSWDFQLNNFCIDPVHIDAPDSHHLVYGDI